MGSRRQSSMNRGHSRAPRLRASELREIDRLVCIGSDAGKAEQGRQLFGKALETMIAAGLDTQGTGPVILLGSAIIQGFVGGLRSELETMRVLGGRDFQLGQGRHVIEGQVPGLATVEVL